MDQVDHHAAVMVQMTIIAEERHENVQQHAGPWSAWNPNGEDVDDMRCDSTHSHLSREQLSKLPSSTSSFDTWVDEVRSKGKSTRCPSCGECAKDYSCGRHISSLEDKVKELKKAAEEKKRDDDSKWKEMEQKLEKLTTFVQNRCTTGVSGPAPAPASHRATYLLSCTYIHALRPSSHSGRPSFYWFTPTLYWESWHSPYRNFKSYWF